MNVTEALAYIHSVSWKGSITGLSRTQELLAKMGSPEKQLKFIHVAGTNGKGSTAAMSWLTAAFSKVNFGLPIAATIVLMNSTILTLVWWASSMHCMHGRSPRRRRRRVNRPGAGEKRGGAG